MSGAPLTGEFAAVDEHPPSWVCRDRGHEFWCRFGPGSCLRTGPLSCNDEEASDG
jgi:hypothetical protein